MIPAVPLVKELVLVGGGHTHALVLRAWGMKPVPGARLTLINPGPTAPYSGMLPGHVAGHYSQDDLQIDLVKLARFAGARLIIGAATGLDRSAKTITIAGRAAPIAYDLLSIDVGVTSAMPKLSGFYEHAIPAKPLDQFAEIWARFCDAAPAAPSVAVIGGGVAGVELAMAAQHRLERLGRTPSVTVVEQAEALTAVPPKSRARLIQTLADAGITLRQGAGVAEVRAKSLMLDDSQIIASDLTIGAGGARPHDWVANLGLETERGYLVVNDQLRSVSDPSIYAVGDCAHLSFAPRPKAGVFAVRAAPILAHNLRADLTGGRPRAFRPQADYLKLISLGRRAALAEKRGVALSGALMWRWKDRIDRAFMQKFKVLPKMRPPALPEGATDGVIDMMQGQPICGACGAKLGRQALQTTLSKVPRGLRDDVLSHPGDDAAVLSMGGAPVVLTTDHLRGFSADPGLLARVAAVHAMGDIWAMGARPQAVLASVTLPIMAPKMQAAWLAEIMAEASAIFAAEGAEIVGGHSAQGAELSLGFTLTGLPDTRAITLAGAQAGDALILTRGLGTGVILAAEMAQVADGTIVAGAWTQMSQPQGDAAALLAPVAHAMTDVTGFGLAGHLIGMCQASHLAADITLADLPVLPGAEALITGGLRASLHDENEAALAGQTTGGTGPRRALIFDPQTSGGFLAALPSDQAEHAVAQIRTLGHDAAIIGQFRTGAPEITLR
ncbi:selenide, water dikinase SelD [Roseobacter sp. HKCCD9010]|uniref:selenide, water dikinase SelD n=1 Tax=unclassified Roseobacter TaxID=196798 RepID=UPI0014926178|nr:MULTISPECIES: selenide, water dikinase SelD [unclassified Roseobacter]MBF9051490.1 selenide, water dikinase SelD [Rhodobacterales bacterium HKCCD4356]NNV13014.1 selenide, water dikinase SelD [Roseobacter sp. HKCCD7357]NNV17265.1 selenide, water dikinase SelD [Roseobacter sp. HKCCD8768]NNV26871.1 selenide, water dikinase SelD [Roseobacter sp. HKCCD8192]NNV30991.1 selenide, water dikinase SelD [Roseobacter sp. HKCCD9061]